ncbi:MAG: hypothetical protein ACHQHO_10295 [Solirubrobacterales bacterium]
MARILRLILEVPDGVTIKVEGIESATDAREMSAGEAVRDYWQHYLSSNSRKIFLSAARIEERRGPGFTLEDIATDLRLDYKRVRSFHRTSGRAAKKWREEKGVEAPIRLDEVEYPQTPDGVGRRTRYELPNDVAQLVVGMQPGGLGSSD